MWFKFKPEGVSGIGVRLKGGEEVLNELIIEADVVIPLSVKKKGKSRNPVSVVLLSKAYLNHDALLPKLSDH